jgi:hypothetical protein
MMVLTPSITCFPVGKLAQRLLPLLESLHSG